MGERLTEGYYRNLRNMGFRHLSAAEILEAAREMHAGISGAWQERDSQRRFREGAIAAGTRLARGCRPWRPGAPTRASSATGGWRRFRRRVSA
jgi:hypothetical protein